MFVDALDMFHSPSGSQSLVGAVGNLLFDKSRKTGTAGADTLGNTNLRDLGRGTPLEVLIQILTQVDSAGGAATVQFQLVMADDEALGTNLVVLTSTDAIAEATLVPGYRARLKAVPPGTTKAYVGVRAVIAGEAVTVGTAFAALIPPNGGGDAVMA